MTAKERLKIEKIKIERIAKPPHGTRWPEFDTIFSPESDPLDGVELSDDQEENAEAIMERVADVFMENEQEIRDAYLTMVNSRFYFVVVFQSEPQKKDFLSQAGWGDGYEEEFFDGLKIAKKLGLDVPPVPLPTKEPKRIPRPLRDVQFIRKGGE